MRRPHGLIQRDEVEIGVAHPNRFTFLLLTYNQVRTVREAVAGALGQMGEPLEILISDDCSSDGTFAAIQSAVAGYRGPHRVVLNRNERNLGLNGHIHVAHEISSGDLIIVAAGDDISLPHRSTRIRALFEKRSPLLVHSAAKVIGPDGEPAVDDYRKATFFQTTEPKVVAGSTALYLGATGAWHKDLYRKYGRVEPDAFEDLVFGFRAALEGRVGFIDEPLIAYRLGAGLTSVDRATMDRETYRRFWIRQYKAHLAAFHQRRADAQTFGLDPRDPIFGVIDDAALGAGLSLICARGRPMEILKAGLMHPKLAFRAFRRERRRYRKLFQ